MEIRKDIFGNIPQIGDTIVFTPASYKQLIYGTCIGYSTIGLPKLDIDKKFGYTGQTNTPKNGFVVYAINK